MTVCYRGRGSKIIKNSVTYFMDGPLPIVTQTQKFSKISTIPRLSCSGLSLDTTSSRRPKRQHGRSFKTDMAWTTAGEFVVIPKTIIINYYWIIVYMNVMHLKNGKAPGVDMISAEEIVASGKEGEQALFSLCRRIWQKEEFPDEWKQSVILPIYKKKDKLICDNYRGISLLCHSQKMMASVMLQRIKASTEEILSEAQAGFRSGRSTIDQLFSLRLLTEKYFEHGKDLYVCYVDFQKAFDSVWRKGLWQVMRHLGYDNKIIRLIESMYRNSVSSVRVGTQGDVSNWFETLVGVLQGCVLSPLLFNILLEVVMALSLEDKDIGATISGFLCSNLRFADDIALLAEKEVDLQSQIDSLHRCSTRFGLKISSSKTEVTVHFKESSSCQDQH